MIATISAQPRPLDELGELFRAVHSIKGSGSTFGLPILAGICSPLEELIQHASADELAVGDFVALARDYLALLRQSITAIGAGNYNFDETEDALVNLHKRAFRQSFSIAVAVNSRTATEICRQIATTLGARVVTFNDSLNALHRVLTEPFNVVVVSSELYPMRGEALIAALKLSYRRGQNLKCILLTASRERAGFVNREVDPDFVVLRDQDFLPHLHAVISDIADASRQEPSKT